MHSPRMAKIDTHPRCGIEILLRTDTDVARSGFVLRLPRKHVIVSSLTIMQERANRAQKLDRWPELFASSFLKQSFLSGPCALFVHSGEQRHPARNVVIAQAPGRLFDVRLKMKDRAA